MTGKSKKEQKVYEPSGRKQGAGALQAGIFFLTVAGSVFAAFLYQKPVQEIAGIGILSGVGAGVFAGKSRRGWGLFTWQCRKLKKICVLLCDFLCGKRFVSIASGRGMALSGNLHRTYAL